MDGLREVHVDGDVVRRPRKPWTATVHHLLRHLRSEGLPVPEPLAIDDEHEYVSRVEGEAGDDVWTERVSASGAHSMGALLRRIHDATRDWVAPIDARWSVPHQPGDVLCHGDPKPGNFAWSGGKAVGLFDWDGARPGTTENDLAYALLWVIPVNAAFAAGDAQDGSAGVAARRVRARALLDGYGWEGDLDVVEMAITRQEQAIEEACFLGQLGHEPQATWLSQNWPERWRQQLDPARAAARVAFPIHGVPGLS